MKTFLAVFFGILAAALIILLVVAYFVGGRLKQEQMAQFRAFDIQEAQAHLRTINVACTTYRSTYEKGFPEKLADLGSTQCQAFSGPHCAGLIDEVLASGSISGYNIIYKPTRLGRSGLVKGYQVWASPQKAAKPPLRSFYVDQTGVIRFTDEGRPASENDPPLGD
jgi:hypothetical protein